MSSSPYMAPPDPCSPCNTCAQCSLPVCSPCTHTCQPLTCAPRIPASLQPLWQQWNERTAGNILIKMFFYYFFSDSIAIFFFKVMENDGWLFLLNTLSYYVLSCISPKRNHRLITNIQINFTFPRNTTSCSYAHLKIFISTAILFVFYFRHESNGNGSAYYFASSQTCCSHKST